MSKRTRVPVQPHVGEQRASAGCSRTDNPPKCDTHTHTHTCTHTCTHTHAHTHMHTHTHHTTSTSNSHVTMDSESFCVRKKHPACDFCVAEQQCGVDLCVDSISCEDPQIRCGTFFWLSCGVCLRIQKTQTSQNEKNFGFRTMIAVV